MDAKSGVGACSGADVAVGGMEVAVSEKTGVAEGAISEEAAVGGEEGMFVSGTFVGKENSLEEAGEGETEGTAAIFLCLKRAHPPSKKVNAVRKSRNRFILCLATLTSWGNQ